MTKLKNLYYDAGGLIGVMQLIFQVPTCILAALIVEGLIFKMLFIGLAIGSIADYYYAGQRFRIGLAEGKIDGLKQAMRIARSVNKK